MMLLDRLYRILFQRRYQKQTIDVPTEDRVTTLFQAWQQGGKEGLRKVYQNEEKR